MTKIWGCLYIDTKDTSVWCHIEDWIFLQCGPGRNFCAVNDYKNLLFKRAKKKSCFPRHVQLLLWLMGYFYSFLSLSASVGLCYKHVFIDILLLKWSYLSLLTLNFYQRWHFKRAEICGSNELSGFFLICFEVSDVRGSVEGILCIWFCHTSFASALSHKSTY